MKDVEIKTFQNKKAQIFTSDIVIATAIFIIILGLFTYLWGSIIGDITDMEIEYEMSWLATAASEKLVRTAGQPMNWSHNPVLSNITFLGLASTRTMLNNTQTADRIIDPEKLLYFIRFSDNNYSIVKSRHFGLGRYEFYAEVSCLDGYSFDCLEGLNAGNMSEGGNFTCVNKASFYISNQSIWSDPRKVATWHFDQDDEGVAKDTAGNSLDGAIYGALKASFLLAASTDSFVYEGLANVGDYTVASGDYLEYDLYWTLPDDEIAVDYTLSDGTTRLRDSIPPATDQNGKPATPSTNLTALALGQWYHRKMLLPSDHVGKKIRYYDIGCENNDGGTRTAYIDNIVITRGGVVRKVVYQGGSFSHSTHFQSNGMLSSLDYASSPTEWNASGKFGAAVSLDGSDDYVSVPGSVKLGLGVNQTISLWVRVDADSSQQVRLAGKGDLAQQNYGLWRNANGDLSYQIGGCAFNSTNHSVSIAAGTGWVHVAATYNGSAGRIYMDGTVRYAGQCNTTPTISDRPFTAGYAGYYGYLAGGLDEIKLWNRTLSESEIQDEYEHNKKTCVFGRNISLDRAIYMVSDAKTVTFRREPNEILDAAGTVLEPTAQLKFFLYLGENEGLITPVTTSLATATSTSFTPVTSTTEAPTTSSTTTTSTSTPTPSSTTTTIISGPLSCTIRNTACLGGETCVFRMSDTSDAHAGTCSDSSYAYSVCCNASSITLSVAVQNGGCPQDGVVSLSSVDNAHAETYPSANYAKDICLTASSGTISCDYVSSCAGACLASMSSATNAHVADCGGYTTKICCTRS